MGKSGPNTKSKRGLLFSLVTIIAIVTAILLVASVCFAGVRWTTDGAAVCTAASNQGEPQITGDGSGGAIITWEDERDFGTTGYDIYAQRVEASGATQWTANGVAICSATNHQYNPQITGDGSGGAIITWEDNRGADTDIYAQRVDASGATQWAANGVAICATHFNQYDPQITGDSSGGAIITWWDNRAWPFTNYQIYAQRVDASGATQWAANGVAICSAANTQINPQITGDGSGGAIITWEDTRDFGTTGYDIYAQRVDASGATQWAANGVAICSAADDQEYPKITGDGAGPPSGAIITWEDKRDYGTTHHDVYAQRVDSGGTVQWTADGVAVCAIGWTQRHPDITGDGTGNAIVTWHDYRTTSQYDIYAQKVDASGASQWTANGVELRGTTVTGDATYPRITGDGSGGGVVTWRDNRSGSQYDIYAQKVDVSGAPKWTTNGVAICTAANDKQDHRITSDGSGGAIITWRDARSGYDIYSQRVSNPAPTVTGITPNFGTNDGVLNITDLAGTWFSDVGGDPNVMLKKAGESDIVAIPGSVTVVSDSEITCDFDLTGVMGGPWEVCVRNADGQTATLPGGFNVNWATPSITSVSPTSGFIGTTVIAKGSSFGNSRGTSKVYFIKKSGKKVAATNYKLWSNNKIKVKVPKGISGKVKVKVKTPGGYSNTKAFKVRPKITSLKPKSGKKGKVVTIKGNAFGKKSKSSKVYFINKKGKKVAARIKSWKGTQIKVKVPRGIKGKVKVKVKTEGGMSNTKSFTVKKSSP